MRIKFHRKGELVTDDAYDLYSYSKYMFLEHLIQVHSACIKYVRIHAFWYSAVFVFVYSFFGLVLGLDVVWKVLLGIYALAFWRLGYLSTVWHTFWISKVKKKVLANRIGDTDEGVDWAELFVYGYMHYALSEPINVGGYLGRVFPDYHFYDPSFEQFYQLMNNYGDPAGLYEYLLSKQA